MSLLNIFEFFNEKSSNEDRLTYQEMIDVINREDNSPPREPTSFHIIAGKLLKQELEQRQAIKVQRTNDINEP